MRLVYSTGLTSLLISLWVIHTCSAAVPNGAHNAEEEQQQPGRPTHGNRLFNRAIRGSHNNAPASRPSKNQARTSSTSPAPPPTPSETENEPEAGYERQEESELEANPIEESPSSTTTSTEAPSRKQGNAERQNQIKKDFLERIEKRRKLQQQKGYSSPPVTTTSTTDKQFFTKSTQSRKTTHSKAAPSSTVPSYVNQGSQKKSGGNRRYNSKATTPVQTTPLPELPSNEAIAEESNVAPQSSKIRTFQKARRTSSN